MAYMLITMVVKLIDVDPPFHEKSTPPKEE
jgi:hypothetical protein